VAELRAGRPVLLHDGQGQRLAVIALDSATASSFAAFANAARERHYLFLTATRARVLGVEAPQGARLPLAGVAFDALPSLGYLREPGPMPEDWSAGDAFDAGAVELARLGLLLPAMVAVRLDADTPSTVRPKWRCATWPRARHTPPTTTNWSPVRRCRCATSA
jgi:GTP cyclohydrolase II